MLIARCYPQGIINSAIDKARSIPRDKALKQVNRSKLSTRPVFMVSWDPRLASISDVTRKHWRVMSGQDPYLQEVFPEPPLVAYKRQTNIRDKVIKTRIPISNPREHRGLPGMKRCGKCIFCPYVIEGNKVETRIMSWNMIKQFNCDTKRRNLYD